MEPLKGAEELVRIRHVEPDTVVPDEAHPLLSKVRLAELDAGDVARAGELPGVPQQVLEQHPQQARVAHDRHALRRQIVDLAPGVGAVKLIDHDPRDGAELHFFPMELRAADAREMEKVLDERVHSPARVAHAIEMLDARGPELLPVLFVERVGESNDASHRGPQIVRHSRGESVELAVRGLERRHGFAELAGTAVDQHLQILPRGGKLSERVLESSLVQPGDERQKPPESVDAEARVGASGIRHECDESDAVQKRDEKGRPGIHESPSEENGEAHHHERRRLRLQSIRDPGLTRLDEEDREEAEVHQEHEEDPRLSDAVAPAEKTNQKERRESRAENHAQ